MTLFFSRSAVLFCLLQMDIGWALAQERGSAAQPAVPEATLLLGLLLLVAIGLGIYFTRSARQVARQAEAANRALHRQIAGIKREGETPSRLEALVECSDDAILMKSLDGTIISWNPAAERMYGYTAEEAVGQHVSFLVPPDRPDEVMQILEKIRRGERVEHYETVRKRKDGRLIYISLSVSPIKDATGKITGASTIARDVTERKRAEEELRRSEELYRDLVENTEDLIYTHDPEGKVLNVNRAMVRHLGYKHSEELIGRNLRDFLASDTLYLFETYLETIVKQGHAQGVIKVMTRSGEKRFLAYRNSLRTEGVTQPTVRGLSHDITEQVLAQTALERRTLRMQALRTYTSEITRVLDLTTLLHLITRRAAQLVGAVAGSIYLWDEAAQVLSADALYSLGEWARGKHLRLGEGIAGTVAQRSEGMIVNDYQTSPYASSFFLERAGFTAVIAEPLLYHDRLVGVLTINNEGTWQFFTDEDRDLLGLFAVEASIAIENARLYSAVADSKRRLEELYELGLAMQEHRTLQANLDLILAGAKNVLEFDRMNVLLADPGKTRLTAVAALGVDEPLEKIYVPLGPEGGGVAIAFLERRDIVWDGSGPVPKEWRLASPYSAIKAFRSRNFVIVPLIVRGAAIGVLGADKKLSRKAISPDTIQLLKIFAAQAAVAIDNARLYEKFLG